MIDWLGDSDMGTHSIPKIALKSIKTVQNEGILIACKVITAFWESAKSGYQKV